MTQKTKKTDYEWYKELLVIYNKGYKEAKLLPYRKAYNVCFKYDIHSGICTLAAELGYSFDYRSYIVQTKAYKLGGGEDNGWYMYLFYTPALAQTKKKILEALKFRIKLLRSLMRVSKH